VTEPARLRLRRLLAEFISGGIDTETFCIQFEHTYNLELDKRTLLAAEAQAFSEVFEQVIWYSPYPEERERIPNYRGETEIREVALRAAAQLGTEPTN
jgi:hypothetical protein